MFEVSQSVCTRIVPGGYLRGRQMTISIGLSDYWGTEPAATIVMNGEDEDER